MRAYELPMMLSTDHQPPVPPSDPRVWKGAFCIPNAFRNIPYGDGRRIWTPAYGCYNDLWRENIRSVYSGLGFTHFVYNCAGLPYGTDYPELADDSARVARDLDELMTDGLWPVVCATDDREFGRIAQSFIENGSRVRICFPMWEMNGVPLGPHGLRNDLAEMKELIAGTRFTAPGADCYLHFTPGHGSIDPDEAGGWHWCQEHGTVGLLAQGDNRFAAEPPDVGGAGLESTAIRLAGRTDLGAPASWAGLHQLTVKFEYGVSDEYRNLVTLSQMINYTTEFLKHAPHVVGYCDGGD